MRIRTVFPWGALVALALIAPLGCGSDKSPTDPGGNGGKPQPASISLSKTSLAFISLQDSTQLTATVKDQNGTVMAGASVKWASTDTTVAKVNSSGWVFAMDVGTASVVATSGTLADTAEVVVTQDAASLEVSPGTASFEAVGDSTRIVAAVKDQNGNAIDGAVVSWTSTDTTVAWVNDDGWVISRGNGMASIIASAGEAADTVAVEVEQVAVALAVNPGSVEVGEGATVQLTAAVTDRNGHPIPGRTITFSSSGPSIASVSEGGLVTGKSRGGSTTVTAKAGEFADTIPVRVMDQIVFANAAGEIYLIDDNGSRQRLLHGTGGRNPVWSPDGQMIAYEDASGGSSQIWVMNADGTGKTRLTTTGTNRSPAWSPLGDKIVFTSDRGGSGTDAIYVMNADGTGQTRLTATSIMHESEPVWSPIGNKIAFVRVLLVTGGEVFVINADGTGETRITNNSASDSHPTWSPDGKKLAFQSNQSGKWRLYVRDFTSNTTELIGSPAAGADWQFPEWSPNGKRILFHMTASGITVPSYFDLDASLQTYWSDHPDAHARFGRWSPDGGRILYSVEGDGLYIWSVDGTDGRKLVTRRGGDAAGAQHAWRPRPSIFIPPIFP